MYNKLISLENIFSAWNEFKDGKQNKTDVKVFERFLEDNIFSIYEDLKNKTYRHGAYKTFNISDPKPRKISKATVRDRLVHHIVFRKLYDIFDSGFIFHSYSSRMEKGTHLAVKNLAKNLRKESRNYTKTIYILKCDIRKFFPSIPHKKLLQLIERKISDKDFLWLIMEIINSFSNSADNFPQEVWGGGIKGKIFWKKRFATRKYYFANFFQYIS